MTYIPPLSQEMTPFMSNVMRKEKTMPTYLRCKCFEKLLFRYFLHPTKFTKNFYIACCPHSGSTSVAKHFDLGHECWNEYGMVSGLHFHKVKPDAILIRNPFATINGLQMWIGNPGWWHHYAKYFVDLEMCGYKPAFYNATKFWLYCYEKLILFDVPVLHLEHAPFYTEKEINDFDWTQDLPFSLITRIVDLHEEYLKR